jgi:hypothetical protein
MDQEGEKASEDRQKELFTKKLDQGRFQACWHVALRH